MPCEERISEENATESTDAIEPSVSDTMSKTSTIAEIISPPQSEPFQERIEVCQTKKYKNKFLALFRESQS